jgi:hypothetical protein
MRGRERETHLTRWTTAGFIILAVPGFSLVACDSGPGGGGTSSSNAPTATVSGTVSPQPATVGQPEQFDVTYASFSGPVAKLTIDVNSDMTDNHTVDGVVMGGSACTDACTTTTTTSLPTTTTAASSTTTTTSSATSSATTASSTTTTSTSSSLWTVSAWETLFLQHWNTDDANVYRPLSLSGDSWDMYNLAFGIDANTAMYRATGETQYLDRTLVYINNVISTARPSSSFGSAAFQDSYLGWVTQRSTPLPSLVGQEIPLFESFMWRYVTEALLVIHQTPALYTNPTYKSQYDSILAFTEVNIFDKWYNRGVPHCGCGGAGWPNLYPENTNMASHWAFISMDLSLLTQDATRQARSVTVYTNINLHMPYEIGTVYYTGSLRQQFQVNPAAPAAYVWDSFWGPYTGAGDPNVQDVFHGGHEVGYITEAYGLGLGPWTTADITALSHTLTDVLWTSNGTYAGFVDGSGVGSSVGSVIGGFMDLGRYSPAIQLRLQNYSGTIGDNYGAVSDFYANGALNAKILGA